MKEKIKELTNKKVALKSVLWIIPLFGLIWVWIFDGIFYGIVNILDKIEIRNNEKHDKYIKLEDRPENEPEEFGFY